MARKPATGYDIILDTALKELWFAEVFEQMEVHNSPEVSRWRHSLTPYRVGQAINYIIKTEANRLVDALHAGKSYSISKHGLKEKVFSCLLDPSWWENHRWEEARHTTRPL